MRMTFECNNSIIPQDDTLKNTCDICIEPYATEYKYIYT